MIKELPHFQIKKSYGGNQDWMKDPIMRMGGCGALTACDVCLVLAQNKGYTSLVPEEVFPITKKSYIAYGSTMKPYLHPRWKGINKLEYWTEGFEQYLKDIKEQHPDAPELSVQMLHKGVTWVQAGDQIMDRIDHGFPVPIMILHHDNKRFKEYEWHWFLLNGYDRKDDGTLLVKAVTYGEYEWLPLEELWITGRPLEDGGIILLDDKKG